MFPFSLPVAFIEFEPVLTSGDIPSALGTKITHLSAGVANEITAVVFAELVMAFMCLFPFVEPRLRSGSRGCPTRDGLDSVDVN